MVRATPLCSPKLLESADARDPAKFIAANDLLHVKIDGRSRHYFWEMFARSLGRPDLPVDRGLVFDTEQLGAQYAMLGDGMALLDPLLFADEIKAGRLARPFDLWLDEGYGYYLTTHPEDLSNEAVALFRSWMIARFSARRPPPRARSQSPPRRQSCARRNRASNDELVWSGAILACAWSEPLR